MAFTPDQHIRMEKSSVLDGERIVISGMSGLFPQARHVKDLAEILYNKVILIRLTRHTARYYFLRVYYITN